MTDIVNRHAKQDRVTIHPEKSNAVVLSKSSSFKRDSFMLNLDDRNIPLVPNTTHLGISRAETNENTANIDERLKLARRTLYSLIGTGVHGSNGINPKVSYKIYQCYVIPRMLYGLEVIPINDSQMENLSKFHLQTLKRIQSLPKRTANCAVYLLLGVLPLQAELHKRQLGLLYNIIFTENETLASLTHRQCAINKDNNLSFYCRVQRILDMYNLPTIDTVRYLSLSKLMWKNRVKQTMHSYWLNQLKLEASTKTTLKNLCLDGCEIGKTHQIWDNIDTTTTDVKRSIIKCRMLTGNYMVQANNHKFSNGKQSALCKCCALKDEDISHMLLDCPSYHLQRKTILKQIKAIVSNQKGKFNWEQFRDDDLKIIQLLMDSGKFSEITHKECHFELEKLSRNLCYSIHLKRLKKLMTDKSKFNTTPS